MKVDSHLFFDRASYLISESHVNQRTAALAAPSLIIHSSHQRGNMPSFWAG